MQPPLIRITVKSSVLILNKQYPGRKHFTNVGNLARQRALYWLACISHLFPHNSLLKLSEAVQLVDSAEPVLSAGRGSRAGRPAFSPAEPPLPRTVMEGGGGNTSVAREPGQSTALPGGGRRGGGSNQSRAGFTVPCKHFTI